MPGLMQILEGEFTDDTLDRYYPNDPMLNRGTMFGYDFSKPFCFPEQNAPETADVIFNLVEGGDNADVFGASIGFSGGGFVFPGTSGHHVSLADQGNMTDEDNDFLIHTWCKQTTATYSASDVQALIGRAANLSGNCQWIMYMNGRIPTLVVANASVNAIYVAITPNDLDVPVLLSMSYEAGVLKFWRNGALVGTHATVVVSPLNDPAEDTLIGAASSFNYFKGTIYRVWAENLTESGKSVAAQVAKEYSLNVSRFT